MSIFISFLWCRVYLILRDPCRLALASVHLSKQSSLPDLTGLFLQEETITSQTSLGYWMARLVAPTGRQGVWLGFLGGQHHYVCLNWERVLLIGFYSWMSLLAEL